MDSIIAKYRDDFLEGSETVYNYAPFTNYSYLLYAQIVGIQNIGSNYYNELELAKEYMVQYTLDGEGICIVNGHELHVKKGDLLLLSNYQHHILKPVEGKTWKFAFVHIYNNDLVADIVNKFYAKHRYVFSGISEDKILPYIRNMINLLNEDFKKNEFKVSSQIYQLLMTICEETNVIQSDYVDSELSGVIHFLNQSFNTPIKLKDILRHTNYSKNHLERLFKSRMNMTIKDYISRLRLRKAQELIATTNMYYKEIAIQVGLTDYRSLVYLFQNSLGITPTEYRERSRRVQKEEHVSNEEE